MQVIKNSIKHQSNIAAHCKNRTFKYSDLLFHAHSIATTLKDLPSKSNVAFLTSHSYEFAPIQWGIWMSGHVSVPLCTSHPLAEWDYVVQDSQAPVILCEAGMVHQISPLYEARKVPVISVPSMAPGDCLSRAELDSLGSLGFPSPSDPAQMIYTSGTTGRPKGVLTSHQAIFRQVSSLTAAWEWTAADHILSFLPLHHVHGNINVVTCALNSGARITFQDKFDAKRVWDSLLSSSSSGLSLLMAVPTVYLKLIEHYKSQEAAWQAAAQNACKSLRLMVSGSMALPEHTLNEWREISGQVLLERYGMTECGMILSNPLHGLRKPGFVGKALPGVQVKVVDNELRVKSLGMFDQYFAKEEPTKEAFDEDGWFKTGDIVEMDPDGDFKILGRASVDILKISGFKVSALDVENDLLGHPEVLEVAAVGVEDKVYGQRVGIVFKAKKKVLLEEIREWAKDKMAHYKVPKLAIQVDEIPRNQMGKVNKKELVKLFN